MGSVDDSYFDIWLVTKMRILQRWFDPISIHCYRFSPILYKRTMATQINEWPFIFIKYKGVNKYGKV